MLKGIIAFGLTRRTIVLVGMMVFVASGIIAFLKLNIEAYPNPAPVILEITAQAAGLRAVSLSIKWTHLIDKDTAQNETVEACPHRKNRATLSGHALMGIQWRPCFCCSPAHGNDAKAVMRITTKAPGYNGIMAPGIPE